MEALAASDAATACDCLRERATPTTTRQVAAAARKAMHRRHLPLKAEVIHLEA